MGRPLYSSILLARQTADLSVTRPDPSKTNSDVPKNESPAVVKWSHTNAFDPDSDEFFNESNAVYEAFLTEEEVAMRTIAEQAQRTRPLTERLLRVAGTRSSTSTLHNEEGDLTNPRAETNNRRSGGVDRLFVDAVVPEVNRNDGVPHTTETPSAQGEPEDQYLAIPHPPSSARDHIAPSRSYPVDLVFGLEHLSESPRPFDPVDYPFRSVSPMLDTLARTPAPHRRALDTAPESEPSSTFQLMSWESPARLELDLVIPSSAHYNA